MIKEQSHKETKVSSDSVIQNSLDKGMSKYYEHAQDYTAEDNIIKECIEVALADQKAKIRELTNEYLHCDSEPNGADGSDHKDGFDNRCNKCKFLKEFEEL